MLTYENGASSREAALLRRPTGVTALWRTGGTDRWRHMNVTSASVPPSNVYRIFSQTSPLKSQASRRRYVRTAASFRQSSRFQDPAASLSQTQAESPAPSENATSSESSGLHA